MSVAVEREAPPPAAERGAPVGGAYVVFLILVGATIPWRSKSYFEGGADPVVLAKAALSLLGCALAVVLNRSRQARETPAAPTVFLAALLLVTIFGGWSDGTLVPSVVVAARMAVLAATVLALARVVDPVRLVGSLVAALASYGLVGTLTGLPSLAEGRLRGALPQLHPNELASIAVLVVLWCLWRVTEGRDRWFHLLGIVVGLGVLLGTGSRTPMAALALGMAVLLVSASAFRLRNVVTGLLLAPVLLYVLLGTGSLEGLLLRGGEATDVTTLSNRTIAWNAALGPKRTAWLTWFGGGLTMKRVEVPGQPWNQQILDSSWISLYVQAGLVGFAICTLWMLHGFFTTARSPRRLRALQVAILLYLVTRGLLESGLFDASTAFLMLFTVLCATPATGAAPEGGAGASAEPGGARPTDVEECELGHSPAPS